MNSIKIKFALPDYKDLLRYGEIESDHEYNYVKEFKRLERSDIWESYIISV